MREIKFRAWDTKLNVMWQSVSLFQFLRYLTFEKMPNATAYEAFKEHPHEFQWLEFTGLKDKNGKEIYEGDILKYWQENKKQAPYNRSYIAFEYGSFVAKDMLEKVGSGTGGSLWVNKDFILKECEVIGNLYENPDLLEEYKALS